MSTLRMKREALSLFQVLPGNASAPSDPGDRGTGLQTHRPTQPQTHHGAGGQAARQMVVDHQGQGHGGVEAMGQGHLGAMETVTQHLTKWTAPPAVKAKEQTEVSMCQNTQPSRRPPKAK